MNQDIYYIFHKGRVYLEEYKGWKNARKAAKRMHSKAFIMSKHWYELLKKKEADRKRWANQASTKGSGG